MARARKKAAPAATEDTATSTISAPEPTPPAPDIFDEQIALRQQEKAAEIVQDVAESTRIEPEQPASGVYSEEHPGNGFAAQHAPKPFIANPSSKRRESHAASVRKLPSTLSVAAGDLMVKLIDKGDNLAGIGIKVDMPEGRKLTDEEKAIIRQHIRGEENENTGYRWDADVQFWHKPIVRENEFEDQVPPSRPVAIRLDAERRVQGLAEALREHAKDPVGYADMVQQRRELAANADRIPD